MIISSPHLQIAEDWLEWANANIDRITSPEKVPLIHVERVLPIIWVLKNFFDVPGRIVFKLMKEQLVLQIAQMDASHNSFIDLDSTVGAFNGVIKELSPVQTEKRATT